MQTILVLQPWNFTQSTTYIIMWVNFTHDSTVLNPFWSIMATSNAWARINPASEGVWKTLKKKWFLKEFQIFRKGLGFRTRIYYSFHDLSISLALLFFFHFRVTSHWPQTFGARNPSPSNWNKNEFRLARP